MWRAFHAPGHVRPAPALFRCPDLDSRTVVCNTLTWPPNCVWHLKAFLCVHLPRTCLFADRISQHLRNRPHPRGQTHLDALHETTP